MTPRALLNVIAGILLLVALGAGGYGVWSYRAMAEQVATLTPLKAEVADLKKQQETLSKEVVRRAEFDSALRAARQTIHVKLDKVTDEDPAARAYLGERIPDGVRGAFPAPQQR